MKIIYESIFNEMHKVVEKSNLMNRRINYIMLTENEWYDLKNELRTMRDTFRMTYDHDLKGNAIERLSDLLEVDSEVLDVEMLSELNEFYLFGVKIKKESGAATEGEVLK